MPFRRPKLSFQLKQSFQLDTDKLPTMKQFKAVSPLPTVKGVDICPRAQELEKTMLD